MAQDFIARLQVSDNGFAFDPKTGSTFSLNHTACRLICLLREGRSPEQMVDDVIREYGIDSAEAHRGVEDFLHSIQELAA
ncbi:MAG: PqqD family protein [Elusimicrobia bacterium]|nr:PqqD family protein [Elusimicrobiota bacterium]